ncbi:MAG: threonine/serine dehydratase [Pseudomonadota bacterium]
MNTNANAIAEQAIAASKRLQGLVQETPLVFSPQFSEITGAKVWLKLENLQDTGSFKLRGASNKLLTLTDEDKAKGCVTASSGNHGAGVALAASRLGMSGIVFVPEHTSDTKVKGIRAHGGDVRFFGTDGLDTEEHARAFAEQEGKVFVSPYNDPAVIAGQGSCGVEIVEARPDIDAAFISIGGGGLISGVASVLKDHNPAIKIVGCQPSNSPVMTQSVEAGEIVFTESEPTLSDGTAGGIEEDAITFELCRALVDDYALVEEDAIAEAMVAFIENQHQLAEGAAGVALGAFLAGADKYTNKNVVIVICGGNVSPKTLTRVLTMTGN